MDSLGRIVDDEARHEIATRNEVVAGGSPCTRSTDGLATFLCHQSGPDRLCWLRHQIQPVAEAEAHHCLQSSVQVEFGLGGTIAAGPSATGRGHYATLTTDWGMIAGNLKVNLHYGFTPLAGDSFTIVKSNGLVLGTFNGLPEGALVERFGDVGLYISYRGGNGSDVVLTARAIR